MLNPEELHSIPQFKPFDLLMDKMEEITSLPDANEQSPQLKKRLEEFPNQISRLAKYHEQPGQTSEYAFHMLDYSLGTINQISNHIEVHEKLYKTLFESQTVIITDKDGNTEQIPAFEYVKQSLKNTKEILNTYTSDTDPKEIKTTLTKLCNFVI